VRTALLLLVLAQTGCDDCWLAPVMSAGVGLELEGDEPEATRARYGVTLGELAGCDEWGSDHDDVDDDTFTPFEGRQVIIQPVGGDPIELVEGEPGHYSAEGVGLAEAYRVIADGEEWLLPAPPFFTAEVALEPELAVTWSNAYSLTSVVIREAGGVGWPGTIDGQRATFDPRAIDGPGDYTAVIERQDWGSTDPDDARVNTAALMTRTIAFTVE
jgi:hypothetical protein